MKKNLVQYYKMSSFGLSSSGSFMDNKWLLLFVAFAVAGFSGGLWGCQLFGNPEKDKCTQYHNWGVWLTFILSLLLLGLVGKKTFSGGSTSLY